MRITITNLRCAVAAINASLSASNNPHRLRVDRRNGHYALDLYANAKCLRNVEVGTARECVEAANAIKSEL